MRSDELRAWLALARADRCSAECFSAGRCACQSAAVSSMGRPSTRSSGVRGAVATFGVSTTATAAAGRFRCGLGGLRRNMRTESWTGSSGLTASAGLGPGAAAARIPQLNREHVLRTAPACACKSGAVGPGSGAGERASRVPVQAGAWRRSRATAGAVGEAALAHRTAVAARWLGRGARPAGAQRAAVMVKNLYGASVT